MAGLQSKQQHNGKIGSIIGRQGGRFQVLLHEGANSSVALKPASLEPEYLFDCWKAFIEMYFRLALCKPQEDVLRAQSKC